MSTQLSNRAGRSCRVVATILHQGGDSRTLAEIRKWVLSYGSSNGRDSNRASRRRTSISVIVPPVDTYNPLQSARVRHVANLLDCDDSQIRRLVANGELEAHNVGRRGVRIFLSSVKDYQDRKIMPAAPYLRPAAPRRKASSSAHRAAMAELQRDGIV